MDGRPSAAVGWDAKERAADPRVYHVKGIGWCEQEGWWRWDERHHRIFDPRVVEDQRMLNKAPADALDEAIVVGVVERTRNLVGFWRELYRVCKHGAKVTVVGPYWSCTDALADPTRVRGLSEQMFAYLTAFGRAELAAEPNEDGLALDLLKDVDFDPVRFVRVTGPEWEARSDEAKSWGLIHSLNVCRRLEVGLVAHKPAREAPIAAPLERPKPPEPPKP